MTVCAAVLVMKSLGELPVSALMSPKVTVWAGATVSTAMVTVELVLPVLPAASVQVPTVKLMVAAAVLAGGVRVAV